MNSQTEVHGFKTLKEVLTHFLKVQYETAPDEDKAFWADVASQNHINIKAEHPFTTYKTVVCERIVNPETGNTIGYSVEDTDLVDPEVAHDIFEYASGLLADGYILMNASCLDFDKFGLPKTTIFRFCK